MIDEEMVVTATNLNFALNVSATVAIIALFIGLKYGLKTKRNIWYFLLLVLVLVPVVRTVVLQKTLKTE